MELSPGGTADVRLMRDGSTLTVVSRDYAATFPVDALERIESRVSYEPKVPVVRGAAK